MRRKRADCNGYMWAAPPYELDVSRPILNFRDTSQRSRLFVTADFITAKNRYDERKFKRKCRADTV